MTKLKYLPIFGPTKRPYRLVAQDSGFSFPQQRFETAWGYKKGTTFSCVFFFNPFKVLKTEQQMLLCFFCTREKKTHHPPLTNKNTYLYLVAQIAPIV